MALSRSSNYMYGEMVPPSPSMDHQYGRTIGGSHSKFLPEMVQGSLSELSNFGVPVTYGSGIVPCKADQFFLDANVERRCLPGHCLVTLEPCYGETILRASKCRLIFSTLGQPGICASAWASLITWISVIETNWGCPFVGNPLNIQMCHPGATPVHSGHFQLLELYGRARDPKLGVEVPSTALSCPLKLCIFVIYGSEVSGRRPARPFFFSTLKNWGKVRHALKFYHGWVSPTPRAGKIWGGYHLWSEGVRIRDGLGSEYKHVLCVHQLTW